MHHTLMVLRGDHVMDSVNEFTRLVVSHSDDERTRTRDAIHAVVNSPSSRETPHPASGGWSNE